MDAIGLEEEKSNEERKIVLCDNKYGQFELYGWSPDASLSIDENYMDLVMLVTRSSLLKQGSMACIIVKPEKGNLQGKPRDHTNVIESENLSKNTPDDNHGDLKTKLFENTLAVATNNWLYNDMESDIHAEVAALGNACRGGYCTQNATAYITMPPCKKCFGSLFVSGITRIVSRQSPIPTIQKIAKERGIEIVDLSLKAKAQMERINELVKSHNSGNHHMRHQSEDEIVERRKRRREEKKQKWLSKEQKKLN